MVAVLSPGKSLKTSFYYNENKLKAGEALCLLAENYPSKAAGLSERDKLGMLQKMAALRPGVRVNSLHISLNFSPTEHLSADRLREIARDYMDRIGFGNQPYLVYQHFDAAHPHIHLLSTNVQLDGKPISLHYLGIRASEPARKMIEEKYGLVKAEDQGKQVYTLKPLVLEKAVYGRSQTKRAIANVLSGVLDSYKYGSLAQLNAVLGLYHIRADQGRESSRIYRHRGLVYHLVDEGGGAVGVPVKASLFDQKPGLDFLEQRFLRYAPLKKPYRMRVKNAVDLALLDQSCSSMEALKSALHHKGIDLVLGENADGKIYGLSYVDHQSKCVFKGSELGKNYSAKAVLERLNPFIVNPSAADIGLGVSVVRGGSKGRSEGVLTAQHSSVDPPHTGSTGDSRSLLELLIRPEDTYEPNPYDLTRRRKKRKKKPLINP